MPTWVSGVFGLGKLGLQNPGYDQRCFHVRRFMHWNWT